MGKVYTKLFIALSLMCAPLFVNAQAYSTSGHYTVCPGAFQVYADNNAGGTWSSSDNTIATVDVSGDVVGVSGGDATISYTYFDGISWIYDTAPVHVFATVSAGTISGGVSAICVGSSTALSDPSAGGAWSTGNNTIAVVDGSGNTFGVGAGNVLISYTVIGECNTAVATYSLTVDAAAAAISQVSGTDSICPGAYAQLTDATSGGVWSTSDITMADVDGTGLVSGSDHQGTVTITYSVTNSCGTTNATFNFLVLHGTRTGFIDGVGSFCSGAASHYSLFGMSDFGGQWSSSNNSVASIDASGNVTGISAGVVNISYTISNSCGTRSTWYSVTINQQPDAISAGATYVCVSSTMDLFDGYTGGTWTSGNTGLASIDPSTGVVRGVSAGLAPITYTLPGGCYTTTSVLVDALPNAGSLSGPTTLSRGGAGTLVDFGANGTGAWTSCNGNYVTVDHNGNIDGVGVGNTLISYTVTNICGSAYATQNIIVGDCTPVSNNIGTLAGSHVYGYSGDGGPATAAQMTNPFGIAADPLGNVFISDFYNNVIRMVDASGNIHTICGTGVAGYNGDLIPGTSAQLNGPRGLALDGHGNLYIADQYNERIRMLNLDNGTIFTVAGTGHHGGWQGYGDGNGGQAIDANLDFPASVALDCGGNIYIADNGSQTVRKIDPTGIITRFAGTGGGGYNGDGIPAISAQLNNPTDVKADCAGNVYIADSWNNRIRLVNSSGNIVTIAGNGVGTYAGDGMPGGSASLWIPNSITLDACGNVYVCDWQNNVVRLLTYTAGPGNNYYISTFAGKNANDWHGYTGDGGNADSAYMYLPAALAIDGSGNIYIADYGNNVVRFMGTTSYATSRFTNGTTQNLNICQNAKNVPIDAKLTVPGTSGKTQTWSVSRNPTHGTLTGLNATAIATGSTVTPSGLTYTPEAGYTGTDEFTILTSDGTHAASTTLTTWITPAPNAGTIAGTSNIKDGNSLTLTTINADANGIWSSSNNLIATVDNSGNVTGVGNGLVSISYTVSNSCGSSTATTGIVIAGDAISKSNAVLFPNPNNGTFQCEFTSETDCQLELSVVDVAGRVIYKQAVSATAGVNIVSVTLPNDVPKPSMLTVSLGNKNVKYPASKITITE